MAGMKSSSSSSPDEVLLPSLSSDFVSIKSTNPYIFHTLTLRGLTDLAISRKEFNLKQYKQCCTAELKEVAIKMHLL